ncbi:MAG: hypothetical protein WBA74_27495, partial [Cyclobacteriaceae bacterium]
MEKTSNLSLEDYKYEVYSTYTYENNDYCYCLSPTGLPCFVVDDTIDDDNIIMKNPEIVKGYEKHHSLSKMHNCTGLISINKSSIILTQNDSDDLIV